MTKRQPTGVVPRLWEAPIGRIELRRVCPRGLWLWQARKGGRWPGKHVGSRTPLDAIEALRQRLQKHLKSEDVTLVLDDFLPEEA